MGTKDGRRPLVTCIRSRKEVHPQSYADVLAEIRNAAANEMLGFGFRGSHKFSRDCECAFICKYLPTCKQWIEQKWLRVMPKDCLLCKSTGGVSFRIGYYWSADAGAHQGVVMLI